VPPVGVRGRREVRPFDLVAFVLLPEHLHTVWVLPQGDSNYSTRWRRIEGRFTEVFLEAGGGEGETSRSRAVRSERGVWQRRFWEHTVRDEDDLERCLNYTHYNPVKHGLVAAVADYPYSSFHRYVKSGDYPPDWGSAGDPGDTPGAEWE
jgi:putative transposase